MNEDLNDVNKMMDVRMDGWMGGYRKNEWVAACVYINERVDTGMEGQSTARMDTC